MKNRIGILFVLSFLMLSFFSCKKDSPTAPDMGYNYFPDKVGHFVVYDVDSFYYDSFTSKIDTFKFQVKEKIESIFTDNQNRPTIRLERYRRYFNDTMAYSALPWILTDVWVENKTVTTAEKVEENVRFVRLVFPVKQGAIWDANVQNTLPDRSFNYQYVDLSKTIGSMHFDSVLQTVYDDGGGILTQREYNTEKYARNVGMVYRQEIEVESQNLHNDPVFFNKPIMSRVTSGYQYTMIINTYGTE